MSLHRSSKPISDHEALGLAVEVNGRAELGAPAETPPAGPNREALSATRLKASRVVAAFGDDPLAAPYKVLAIQVRRRLRERGWRTLGVTSPGRGEGKTLTAINLSVSLAAEPDQTVLLVDADLKRPSAHRLLGVDGASGVVDHLREDIPSERLIVDLVFGRLALLPAGRAISDSAELLGSSKMGRLLADEAQRDAGRLVIADMPPVLDGADALAFTPYVEAVLLVIDAGRTRSDEVERALQLLHGTPVLGTVLNKA